MTTIIAIAINPPFVIAAMEVMRVYTDLAVLSICALLICMVTVCQ